MAGASDFKVGKTKKTVHRKRQTIQNIISKAIPAKPLEEEAHEDEMVLITTQGPGHALPKTHRIYPKLLFAHSSFFKKWFHPRGGPHRSSFMDLSMDCRAMAHFISFCNRDRIFAWQGSPPEGAGAFLPEMIALWLLAAKLCDVPLQNLAMLNACIAGRKEIVLAASDIVEVYAKTDRGSPLRKYIVANYAWAHDSSNLEFLDRHAWDRLPRDFKYDMFQAQSSKVGPSARPHVDPNTTPDRFFGNIVEVVELSDEDDEVEQVGGGEDADSLFV